MNEILYAAGQKPEAIPSDSWCVVLCREGNARLVTPQADAQLQPGDAAVFPSCPDYAVCGETRCTHLLIRRPTLIIRRMTVIQPQFFRQLEAAADAAVFHFATPSFMRSGILTAYGSVIVGYLISDRHEAKRSDTVSEIADHILAHYADSSYELDTYMRTLPFSYDYLRKLFQSEMGFTPHQFLMDMRLQAAAYLLSQPESERSMTDVARMCGFREPLYFSRMFKKKFGVAPSYYAAGNALTSPQPTSDA